MEGRATKEMANETVRQAAPFHRRSPISEGKVKKPEIERKAANGWTIVTNVRANCTACGANLGLGDEVYWKREGERSIIRCKGCSSN